MDFDLVKMLTTQVEFKVDNSDVEEKGSTLTVEAALEYNDGDMRLVRMNTESNLVSKGKYNLKVCIDFYFKFKEDVTGDEAEEKIKTAKTEAMLYPYIHSYMTNFIAGAGYARPNIPLVFF